MSLTKLFNFKYFKENLKKSKSVLLLLLLILPMFTVLQLMNDTSVDVYTYPLLGVINMLSMCLIPFMLSITLFGYVYKRKSVDFMGSMPISRKTIFMTNTIGGIMLIIFTQLLTFILTMITSNFISATIFTELAFDVFIYQSIAYIFLFCLSNLAMSFSGNLMTQLVVTVLFFAIYPVLNVYISESGGSYINFDNWGANLIRYYNHFTLPIMVVANSGKVAAVSIIKTILLSIIYSLIGLYLFTKRKMEKAGESFSYEITHFIIKGLTLIPFAIFTRELMTSADFSEICLIGGIILVYWYVYDLVTAKKVKLYKSAIALVCSFVILLVFLAVGVAIDENRTDNIEIADIDYIVITDDGYRTTSYGTPEYNMNKKYKITDKDDIKKIFKYIDEKNEILDAYDKIGLENVDNKNTITIIYDCKMEAYVNKYDFLRYYTSIDENLLNEITTKAEVIEEKWELKDSAVLGNKFETITKEEEDRIIEIIKTLEPRRIRQNQEYLYVNDTEYIVVHQYVDHTIETCEYTLDSNEELRSLYDAINLREMKYVLENKKENIGNVEIESILQSNSKRKNVEYYLSYHESEEFLEYIEDNLLNQEVDYSKDIISIMLRFRRDNDRTITIKTNDYDGVISMLAKIGAINEYIYREEYYYDKYFDEVVSIPTVSAEEVIVRYEGELVQEIY